MFHPMFHPMFLDKLLEKRYEDFNDYILDKSYEIENSTCPEVLRPVIHKIQNPFKNPYKTFEDFMFRVYRNEGVCDMAILDPFFKISDYEKSKNKDFLKNPINKTYVLSCPENYMKELEVTFNVMCKEFPITDANKYYVLAVKLDNNKVFMRPFTQFSVKDFLEYISVKICENTNFKEVTFKSGKRLIISEPVNIDSMVIVSSDFDKDIENDFKRLDPMRLIKRRRRQFYDITDIIEKFIVLAGGDIDLKEVA